MQLIFLSLGSYTEFLSPNKPVAYYACLGRYWIWSKILENLASIGYDPTSAYTASYDWRLSYFNLEVRDHYFSKLKAHIETTHKLSGQKIALVTHSMGSQVAHYFFKWVEAEGYGNGGPTWVDDHIGRTQIHLKISIRPSNYNWSKTRSSMYVWFLVL
jgi:hypothetical protein